MGWSGSNGRAVARPDAKTFPSMRFLPLLPVLIACAAAVSVPATVAAALSRSALGLVVGACRANALVTSSPSPCVAVVDPDDGRRGYAILREPADRQRTILAPLADIPGIEDPTLLAPGAPNFFADAWKERRRLVDATPGRTVALAINAKAVRSQDRFHIHIACLDPGVRDAVARRAVAINPDRFAQLNFRLQGHAYWAMRVRADSLEAVNPLQLLASKLPKAAAAMGGQMLLVLGTTFSDGGNGFVFLTNPPGTRAPWMYGVEPLLDPTCSR
jgi:CDP-diacylglycerol pyrophosphatase